MNRFNHSYALVIGIDTYEHGIAPLNNAVNDARAIADLLESKHGYKVWRLLDQEASHETIQHYLKAKLPQQIQERDRLLFYFSGHGIQLSGSDGPEGYLIPQTAHLGQSKTYLSMHEVVQALNELPCRHLLSILDCCFAGSFRWSSQHRKIVFDSEPLYREKYDRYIRDRAWQAITSAAYDQLAYDAFDLKNDRGQDKTCSQHSPFAAALLSGLSGGADMSPPATKPGQKPGDGVTTATELYQYLRDAIEPSTEQSGMRQTPELCSLGKHDKGEYIFLTPDHPLNLPSAPSLDRTTNPYKGLASFEEDDRDRYFGRKEITTDLYQFFLNHQLTIVLGPSGSGKSSLVKAGLLPRVRATKGRATKQNETSWIVLPPFRPGLSPFQALNKVLAQRGLPIVDVDASATLKSHQFNEPVNEQMLSQTLSPEAALKHWFDQNSDHLLVVIDQFEELVTQCNDQERQQFLETLAIALKTYPKRLRAVITLRSDFESQFQDSALANLWQESRFQVSALSRQELRQAIEEPAALRVLFFDPPDLVECLVDEVVNMPGGLPLLSFALSELYLNYLHRQETASKQGTSIERAITEEDYTALGGVTLALIQRAETEYQQLVKEETVYAETIQQVMLRMVALEADGLARRSLLVSEQKFPEPEHSRVQTVLNRFLEARLLVAGKTTDDEPFVEPAHDALVRGWPRLSQWLKQKEIQETVLLIRALTTVANQWDSSEKEKELKGLLWKDDPRLPQAVQVMCGASHQEGQSSFIPWLCQSALTKLRTQQKSFWEALSRSVWLNSKEEQFVKDSLDLKYRSRFIRYSAVASALSVLFLFATVAEVQRNLANRERNISNIREQSARALNWLSAEKSSEGLALSVNALQSSMQYPERTQSNALSSIITAVQNAREQNRLYKHEGSVRAVAYSPDSRYIISGSVDNKLMLWNAETGSWIRTIEASQNTIYAVDFSPNNRWVASAGKDKIIRIWDVETGEQIGKDLIGHSESVRAISFSPDGKKLASGSDDATLRIWDIESGQSEAKPHWGSIWTVAYSPDGSQIATGSTDRTVRLWDTKTGKMADSGPMKGHQGSVFSVAFDADGKRLVSGGSDRRLKLWDTQTQKQIGESLRGHSDKVYAVKFSPDNRYIISAGADRSIRLWDAESGESSRQILDAHRNLIWSIDVNHDTNQIVSSSSDRSIRLWDIRSHMPTGQPLVSDHKRSILSIALSPDGQYLASSDEEGKIKLWQNHTKRQQPVDIGAHSGAAYSVDISPNSQQIASVGNDGTLRIWDTKTKTEIHKLKGHGGQPIYSMAFSPDGNVIVSGGKDGNLNLWDTTRGEQIGDPLVAHELDIYSVAFSPDGRYILSGSRDDSLILWDAKTQQPIRTFEGHTNDVWSVAFSHDGQKIASGSIDQKIIIWETHTGKQIKTLTGHTNTVWSVQFSPDPHNSNLLVSGSNDRTVRLWDIEQGQQVGPALAGHTNSVWTVRFNSQGTRVLSAGADLSLRIWPADWKTWPEMACERLWYHPILKEPESIFDSSDQESINIAKQTKSACDQEFWKK